jgi:hypothetical protein
MELLGGFPLRSALALNLAIIFPFSLLGWRLIRWKKRRSL